MRTTQNDGARQLPQTWVALAISNNTMARRPVNEVMQALRVQLAENGFKPDENGIRNYAQAISDVILTE
jgi:hypothetical protein